MGGATHMRTSLTHRRNLNHVMHLGSEPKSSLPCGCAGNIRKYGTRVGCVCDNVGPTLSGMHGAASEAEETPSPGPLTGRWGSDEL